MRALVRFIVCIHIIHLINCTRDEVLESVISSPKHRRSWKSEELNPEVWVPVKVTVGPSSAPNKKIDCTIYPGTTKLGPGCGKYLGCTIVRLIPINLLNIMKLKIQSRQWLRLDDQLDRLNRRIGRHIHRQEILPKVLYLFYAINLEYNV